MDEQEFWLIMEAKQQSLGKLTHKDYQSIQEFIKDRPKTTMSIRNGKR
jgi:hypothetical protein